MSWTRTLGFTKDVGTGVAGNAVYDGIKSFGDASLSQAIDELRIKQTLERILDDLPTGSGLLVFYSNYRDATGKQLKDGPIVLGEAKKPHDALLDTFSTRNKITEFEGSYFESLNREDIVPEESKHYWIVKRADGKFDIGSIPGDKLLNYAYRIQYSRVQAARIASESEGLEKMLRNAQIFRGIENAISDRISSAGAAAELAQLTSKMAVATRQFKEAQAKQMSAIKQASRVSALAEIGQLLGVVAALTGAAAKLTAEANYHKTEAQNAGNTYNITVTEYKTLIINYGASPEQLPENPTIELY